MQIYNVLLSIVLIHQEMRVIYYIHRNKSGCYSCICIMLSSDFVLARGSNLSVLVG